MEKKKVLRYKVAEDNILSKCYYVWLLPIGNKVLLILANLQGMASFWLAFVNFLLTSKLSNPNLEFSIFGTPNIEFLNLDLSIYGKPNREFPNLECPYLAGQILNFPILKFHFLVNGFSDLKPWAFHNFQSSLAIWTVSMPSVRKENLLLPSPTLSLTLNIYTPKTQGGSHWNLLTMIRPALISDLSSIRCRALSISTHPPLPPFLLRGTCTLKHAGIHISSSLLKMEWGKNKRAINKQKDFNEYLHNSLSFCPDLQTL